jgi:hypothetical protein
MAKGKQRVATAITSVLAASAVLALSWDARHESRPVPNAVSFESIGLPDYQSQELTDNADLVVDVLVLTKVSTTIAAESHRRPYLQLSAEQQELVQANLPITEWKVRVLAWHKGSSAPIIYAVTGDGASAFARVDDIDPGTITVGQTYRMWLADDEVWFVGSDHYTYGAATSGL